MNGLTTALLQRACRIFLELAYPEGRHSIPPFGDRFLTARGDEPLDTLLAPPLCQVLPARSAGSAGGVRGCALRLGSAHFPHLKLQVVSHEEGACVFSVDTHDGFLLPPNHPDSPRWAELQTANRQLKERIERAWEAAGLLTFNALLRQELERKAAPPSPPETD